ncbi:TetR/AcrR family transcriptional regulator [Thalassospira sp. MCCC 1A01428]|uniref:TetR/AcrR family transcriptional regulator n=1 Tax=Thalassospira sp. MCCC 1A01428 TaxID=1470575 RepID=UPI000A1D728A|nr:TetR/AcrR family transcriptional regulator [Thalassospira sp. MCCC 1A01428]OSQ46362.1 transcriptional regulator [Thalassospira sp. MCCC 1A01428]
MKPDEKSHGGRPWSFDREQAIETAMQLFWQHGYEGVSVGDLTKVIGVAPPSLYAAFGNKAGLYQEAVKRYEEKYGSLDFASVANASSTAEAVRKLLEGAVRAVTDPARPRGCMISSGMVACHPNLHSLALDAAARREVLRESVANALRPFTKNGDEAHRLARYVSAILQGISIQARDGVAKEDLQAIVEDVVSGLNGRGDGNN